MADSRRGIVFIGCLAIYSLTRRRFDGLNGILYPMRTKPARLAIFGVLAPWITGIPFYVKAKRAHFQTSEHLQHHPTTVSSVNQLEVVQGAILVGLSCYGQRCMHEFF